MAASPSYSRLPSGQRRSSLFGTESPNVELGLTDLQPRASPEEVREPSTTPENASADTRQSRLDSPERDANTRGRSSVSSGRVSITLDQENLHETTSKNKGEHSRDDSKVRLISTPTSTYTLKRYILRSILNTLGPILVIAAYLFIVLVYLRRPSVNDVVPYYPFDPKGVFFAWLILSIFVLDWAKSGLAGFEASALMNQALAPRTAMQLMWHADRAWGSLSGWWNGLIMVYTYIRRHHPKTKRSKEPAHGPGGLWLYLSFGSFILYAAIPLAGLSMDPAQAWKLSDRPILILGPNQTSLSFDLRPSNGIAEQTNSRWRQGNPTTPQGETIFYAPKGTPNVTSTHYEDTIQAIYSNDLDRLTTLPNSISIFSGPQVSERAHGTAWGLVTNLTCSLVPPYQDSVLLKVQAVNNWTSLRWGLKSSRFGTDPNKWGPSQSDAGLSPALFNNGFSWGVSYMYLIASDLDIEGGSDYVNQSAFPRNGSLELVMWQAYNKAQFTPDNTFLNMSSHPLVVSSVSPVDNLTYLGYRIHCSVNSSVGVADLDAASRSYSNFSPEAAEPAKPSLLGFYGVNQYPGVLGIQSLVYGAFTTIALKVFSPPVCQNNGLGAVDCNPWFCANVATGGTPILVPKAGNSNAGNLQYPTIAPERMKLAIYKLFGEAAIAMMASGPGSWTGELRGLDKANDLVPGRVPWQVVLALLSLWVFITVIPSLWTCGERRWSSTLEGTELFRLGAEWQAAVRKFEGGEFKDCESLAHVPGMVGDMAPREGKGFIGLSWSTARVGRREYVYNR